METINPNDITEVDKNSISLITLKNGNMIMIDDSVPEKPKTEKKQINDEQPKSEKKPQPLSISKHLTCSFKGKEQPIKKNPEKISEKIVEKKIIVKSDFNSLSKVSKNTNFSYSGIPRENATNNNFSNFKFNNNQNTQMTNFNANIGKANNLDFSKSLNNFSPIQMGNPNTNASITNFNSNILLNNNDINNSNKPKEIQFENNNISSNNNLNASASNEDENKEEDITSRINKKSKNYLERIEKMVGDRNSHTIKAVISLNIPCDNPTIYTKTQKQFDKLMAQLRGRQNKYRTKKDEIKYPKYYHLYRDNHNKLFNEIVGPNTNRIKYYEEAEAIEKENEVRLNPNESLFKSSLNNNSILMNNSISNNTFYSGFNNNNNINNKNNKNKSISNIGCGSYDLNKTSCSFYGNKTRATSENKMFSSRLVGSNFGLGSGLIYPCNKFVKKYDFKFL
jgi:hypothetical protein